MVEHEGDLRLVGCGKRLRSAPEGLRDVVRVGLLDAVSPRAHRKTHRPPFSRNEPCLVVSERQELKNCVHELKIWKVHQLTTKALLKRHVLIDGLTREHRNPATREVERSLRRRDEVRDSSRLHGCEQIGRHLGRDLDEKTVNQADRSFPEHCGSQRNVPPIRAELHRSHNHELNRGKAEEKRQVDLGLLGDQDVAKKNAIGNGLVTLRLLAPTVVDRCRTELLRPEQLDRSLSQQVSHEVGRLATFGIFHREGVVRAHLALMSKTEDLSVLDLVLLLRVPRVTRRGVGQARGHDGREVRSGERVAFTKFLFHGPNLAR